MTPLLATSGLLLQQSRAVASPCATAQRQCSGVQPKLQLTCAICVLYVWLAGYVGSVTSVTTEVANDQGLTNSCLNVSVGLIPSWHPADTLHDQGCLCRELLVHRRPEDI